MSSIAPHRHRFVLYIPLNFVTATLVEDSSKRTKNLVVPLCLYTLEVIRIFSSVTHHCHFAFLLVDAGILTHAIIQEHRFQCTDGLAQMLFKMQFIESLLCILLRFTTKIRVFNNKFNIQICRRTAIQRQLISFRSVSC